MKGIVSKQMSYSTGNVQKRTIILFGFGPKILKATV